MLASPSSQHNCVSIIIYLLAKSYLLVLWLLCHVLLDRFCLFLNVGALDLNTYLCTIIQVEKELLFALDTLLVGD